MRRTWALLRQEGSTMEAGLQQENTTFNAQTPQQPYDDYRGKLVDPADELEVSGVEREPASVQ